MSLYGVLRTGVSGLVAQASKLGTVADNIANANTTGYKRAGVEFSSLVIGDSTDNYNSGGVTTSVRYSVAEQGSLLQTTSATDLAVDGKGFFVVTDTAGTPFLTRAGAFVPNGDGALVNAAGYTLMGYPVTSTGGVANGLSGLQEVNITLAQLDAMPSTTGQLFANLPSNAAAVTVAADLPSANTATATPTAKSSLVSFDNLGNEVLLDMYFTKTAAETWEVAVYNQADAPATGGFPYAAGPLATQTLAFDATTGELSGTSADAISLAVPGGATLDIDLSQMTQLAADFTVMAAEVDGSAPSAVDDIEITEDGTLIALLENGSRQPLYQVALADVTSPDKLRPVTGNVFVPTNESGDVRVGAPGQGSFGTVVSGALEQSNVDLGSELVSMIEAQRGYTANSKVFQTGAELLDVLINLKR